jgi:hypothetical protein
MLQIIEIRVKTNGLKLLMNLMVFGDVTLLGHAAKYVQRELIQQWEFNY